MCTFPWFHLRLGTHCVTMDTLEVEVIHFAVVGNEVSFSRLLCFHSWRFQMWIWGLRSTEIWRRVTGWSVLNISEHVQFKTFDPCRWDGYGACEKTPSDTVTYPTRMKTSTAVNLLGLEYLCKSDSTDCTSARELKAAVSVWAPKDLYVHVRLASWYCR
jgi:hypothetical protein